MKIAIALTAVALVAFGAGWFLGPVLDGSFTSAHAIVVQCNHIFASTDYRMSDAEKAKCQAARDELRRETLAKLDGA